MRVHVNCAISLDGKLALAGGKPLRLSSEEDLARVHRLRASVDAVLVGSQTVINDDPSLLVKDAHAKTERQPARVVLDARGRVPATARVFDGRAPAYVVTSRAEARWPHAETVLVPATGARAVDVRAALAALEARGVRSLLVEGGGRVIRSFLDARAVDAFTVFVAPVLVGSGAPALFEGEGAASEGALTRLRLGSARALGEGVLLDLVPP